MKNFIQNGEYIDFTAGAEVASGALVQVGDLHGVSVTAVANGGQGSLAMSGVFRLPKLVAAAGDATTVGGPVYFSAGSVSGTDSSGTRKLCGYALEAAAQATTTVLVRLLG
jgi:predicted RecA/RadA family phage recombinase